MATSFRGSGTSPTDVADRATKVDAAKKHLIERAEAAVRTRANSKVPAAGAAGAKASC